MTCLLLERASKTFSFILFQPLCYGMHEDLAGQLVNPPRLTAVSQERVALAMSWANVHMEEKGA